MPRPSKAGAVTGERPVKLSIYLAAELHRRIVAGAREAGFSTIAEFMRHASVAYLDRQAERAPRVVEAVRVVEMKPDVDAGGRVSEGRGGVAGGVSDE